jgi:hypothetical protein
MLFFRKILDTQSAEGTKSDVLGAVDLNNINELTYYIVYSASCSAGAVQPETAHAEDYTGTWAAEGSPVTFGDNVCKIVAITGVTMFRRVRISTAIVGGTVSVWALGR